MKIGEAKKILGSDVKQEDGGLVDVEWYLEWEVFSETAILGGHFTATELEAIACWMKHKKEK